MAACLHTHRCHAWRCAGRWCSARHAPCRKPPAATEADLAECRDAFGLLDVRQLGRVTIEDLELARQPRLLRVAPKLRQRRLRRLRKSFGEALNTTKSAVVRASNKGLSRPYAERRTAERIEDWFPHWKTGRKGRDAEGGAGGSASGTE